MIHLEVAVNVPLHTTLSYLLPPVDQRPKVATVDEYIGRRVLVPLGRRTVTGYVIGLKTEEGVAYRLRKIERFADDRPLFSAEIVPFFLWVAEYYQHPIGEVITTALPAGLSRSSHKVIRISDTTVENNDTFQQYLDRAPEWFEQLRGRGKLSAALTKKIFADKKQYKALQKLQYAGVVEVENELSDSLIKEKKEPCFTAQHDFEPPELGDEVDTNVLKNFQQQLKSSFQMDFKSSEVKALYYYGRLRKDTNSLVPQKDILKLYTAGHSPLKSLCEKGILTKTAKRVYRNPLGEIPHFQPRPEKLTAEQKTACSEIQSAFDRGKFTPFLLHGITGSGKTEVYLQVAEHCLSKDKDVLVLVPEIALATQLESHFVSRFGDHVGLLHSGLSKGEKYDQWSLAASGQVKIIIGARSAVFAPLKKIGIIIVDEEHDGGFKQHDGLKYNGRDLAVLRAKLGDSIVVLGSATPSITSYHHARNGKYRLLKMNNRVGTSSLPQVEIIDLSNEVKGRKTRIVADRFIQELEENLKNNEQSLVLINRRGFSASYICQECGTAVQCKHCKVTLAYHKQKGELLCHYCGYSVSHRLICENCHSETLVPFGIGTERVEEELLAHFPSATIQRLDSDTAADRKKFLKILKSMRDRGIDILIGTQMIAKGHHFPFVTFVGVVWADGGLNMPDFRAAERTYQLLSQVTGRAGRDIKKGRVIIQTMLPNHYAINYAKNHDYESFFQREILLRKRPAFPPFVRLACFRVSGETEFDVRKTSEKIAAASRKIAKTEEHHLEVFGPVPSPLEKIKDKYRWQILLKSPSTSTLHFVGKYISENMKQVVHGKTSFGYDLDPENMM